MNWNENSLWKLNISLYITRQLCVYAKAFLLTTLFFFSFFVDQKIRFKTLFQHIALNKFLDTNLQHTILIFARWTSHGNFIKNN